MSVKDDLHFLIERYGYARRNGEHQGKKSAEWMAEIDHTIDACVAEALADPLAMLEALAKDEYCAILRTGGEESFTVSVYSEPDMTKGGFHYWIAEPGEDEATEVPRTEALALLAGKGKGDAPD